MTDRPIEGALSMAKWLTLTAVATAATFVLAGITWWRGWVEPHEEVTD